MQEKKENSVFRIAFNLIAACFISGLVIGAVYYVTAPIAAQKAEEMKEASLRELVPSADSFQEISGKDGWVEARTGKEVSAYIIPSESKGYGGTIKMLVAVTLDGRVLDYKILSHNETPGLGDNAQKPAFRKQFEGKGLEHLTVVKDPANKEDIQAMTGATISSRAVTKAVRQAVEEARTLAGGRADAETSATKKHPKERGGI